MTRHNYTPLPMFLPHMNFLHLTVFEIWPRQDFSRSRSLQQGKIKVKLWRCTAIPCNQCPYQISTSYTLRFPRYGPDKIFKVKVTTARSKVKSRLNYDVAHLHPLTNVPTKYHHPTPYSYWDLARTRYLLPPARPTARPPDRPPAQPDAMGENNTPKPFKAVG